MKNINLEEILVCTKCKSVLKKSKNNYDCPFCSISYPISDGFPIMVLDASLDNHIKKQIKYFSNEQVSLENSYRISPWQESYVNRFLDTFGDVSGKVIFDGGSGSGYMTIELAKRGAFLVSADVTYGYIARLDRISEELGLKSNIATLCCDIQELPFRDNTFDFYISNAVLEHLSDDVKTISEINRVCKKKDSGVLIAVPISYKYLTKVLVPINYIHDKRIGHLRRYDLAILKKRFKGWDVRKVFYTGHFKKVLKTLTNMVFPVFDECAIEKEDSLHENFVKTQVIL